MPRQSKKLKVLQDRRNINSRFMVEQMRLIDQQEYHLRELKQCLGEMLVLDRQLEQQIAQLQK